MNLDFRVHTFGCKVNSYDSGLIEKNLAENEFRLSEEPRIHVLNTCAVTAEATREAGRMARRLKARDPFCLVVATGCAAQVDTEELSGLTAIDLVVANSHKSELPEILQRHYKGVPQPRVFKSNIFKKEDLEAGGGTDSLHTRAFLKVQDGCDSFCTFCVIPFARGKSRSIPVNDLVKRVRELESRGTLEVVLTGVHIGDYRDGDHVLEDLLETLLKKTSVPRLRLSSLEPPELSDRMLEFFSSDRICPHFHMSIQSAQSEVLRNMKRRYDSGDVAAALLKIERRVPQAFVGMDVIAGFPTETDAEFIETYERLGSLPWTRLHVFPYSRRTGTFAARYPTLPATAVKKRAAMLRSLSEERNRLHALRQVRQTKKVLLLRGGGQALSRDFWTVEMPHTSVSTGQEITVVISGIDTATERASIRLLAADA